MKVKVKLFENKKMIFSDEGTRALEKIDGMLK